MSKVYDFMKAEAGSWQSPKYKEAVRKAVEVLESKQYKDVLSESDFWQLTGKTKTGKTAYRAGKTTVRTGKKAYQTAKRSAKLAKNTAKKTVKATKATYVNPEQGIYEVGEVSRSNCTNAYPYAMALKRCMDRVILKNSKLAYAGIYSDSEAEEFKNEPKEAEETKPEKNEERESYTVALPDGAMENPRAALVNYAKDHGLNINQIAKTHKLNNGSEPEAFLRVLAELIANEMEEGTV